MRRKPIRLALSLLVAGGALLMTVSGGPPPDRRLSDADSILERCRDFLAWIHPESAGCGAIEDLRLIARWDEGMRLRYRVGCPGKQVRDAVIKVREGRGVWQVAGGYLAAPELLDREMRALGPQAGAVGGERDEGPGGEMRPPPSNSEVVGAVSPLQLISPARVTVGEKPEKPEEAGRSRLIGPARVEILVDVTRDGVPQRGRTLRGPRPDLGMRRAAIDAVLKWKFHPATLAAERVRSFVLVPITFEGLPAESTGWIHRALFHLEGIVSADRSDLDRVLSGVERGEAIAVAARGVAAGPARRPFPPGDWGMVAGTALPAALRRDLHSIPVGDIAGPVEAGRLYYLARKLGEVYYAIRSTAGDEISYQIVHQRNPPEDGPLKMAIEADIAAYLAESRRTAFVNEAARLMGIRLERVELGRLVVHTDVLDREEIERLKQVVAAAIEVHESFWTPILQLRPFEEIITVYAFARAADHDRARSLWRAGSRIEPSTPGGGDEPDARAAPPIWSRAGEYIPASRILSIPCEEMQGHLPVPIVTHEAIHMLNFERVYSQGVRPTQWFGEGLATYYSFSRADSQLRIQPGTIRKTGTIDSGNILVRFDPREPLRRHLRRVQEDGPVPLRELLGAGPGGPLWGGGHSARAYGAAWTLVHFLNHGDKGRHRPRFLEYAGLEARGEGGLAAFTKIFGPDLSDLETAWHEYEQRL
jgi:hypothetical protein